jgi:hypothetical protein
MKANYIFLLLSVCIAQQVFAQNTNNLVVLAGQRQPGYLDGQASESQFDGTLGMDCSPRGQLFIADFGNSSIRTYESGKVATLAQLDCAVSDLTTDTKGNTLLVQSECHVITMLEPDGSTRILAGIKGTQGVSPDGMRAVDAHLCRPLGIAFRNNRIYFSEQGSHSI